VQVLNSKIKLVLEEESTSTRENALRSLALLAERGWTRKAVLVTSPFHQWRAERVFRKAAAELGHAGMDFAVAAVPLEPDFGTKEILLDWDVEPCSGWAALQHDFVQDTVCPAVYARLDALRSLVYCVRELAAIAWYAAHGWIDLF